MHQARTSVRRRRRCVGGTAAIAFLALTSISSEATGGAVLALEGGQAHLEVEDAPGLHSPTALTLSTWFRADKLHSWQSLLWKGDQPDRDPWKNREFGLFLNGGSVHISSTPVSRRHRGHLYLDTPRGAVQAGRWHHVAAVITSDVDGGAMRIYVDGELAASRPYDRSGIQDATGPLWIGGIPGQGVAFHGQVDEVQLWRRALTGDEIRARMAAPAVPDDPGLMAYYRFDETTVRGAVLDHTGRHHGRLVSGAYLRGAGGAVVAALPAITIPQAVPQTTTTTTTSSGPTTTTTTAPPAAAAAPALLAFAEVPGTSWISGEQADLVIQAIGSHDHEVRHEAVKLIPRLDPGRRTEAMRRAIKSHDSFVRRHAAGLLSQVEDAGAGDITQLALQHHDAQVRLVATRSLNLTHVIPTVPVVVLPVPAAVPSVPVRPAAPEWSSHRYEGWEHKWSAEGPDFWGLEQQGLLARYNRAEGLFLGWRQAREYQSQSGVANYGELGHGLASGAWRWQAGGELFTYYGPPTQSSHLAVLGVELHDLTDTQDGWLISEEENSAAAALLRRDYRDHHRRTGGSLYTSHNIGGVLQVGARWSRDRFESMDNNTDWALFGESWSDPAFRANPAIDEGDVINARADVQLDTRNQVGDPHRGWFINAYAERSGGVLGGDYRFKRYLLDLRRYQPMGTGTRLDLRLRGGTAKGDLPRQYVYRLGGLGSVRGYGFKAFAGDRSVLVNAQYWIDADSHWQDELPLDGLGLGVFFDAGTAWFAHDRSDPFTGFRDLALGVDTGPAWKRALGLAVGTADDGLRLEFARALDDDPGAIEPTSAGWSMTARISRAF